MKKINSEELLKEFDLVIQNKNSEVLLTFLKNHLPTSQLELKKRIKLIRTESFFNPEQRFTIKTPPHVCKNVVLGTIALIDKKEALSLRERFLARMFDYINDIPIDPFIGNYLIWAKPTWLEDYLINILQKDKDKVYGVSNYRTLLFLEKDKLIHFHPELFAHAIAHENYYMDMDYLEDSKGIDESFALFSKEKKTIERDLLTIFDYDVRFTTDRSGKVFAFEIIQSLIEQKKLNRQVVLEKALLTQTKNWSKQNKSFHRKFLENLQPSVDELIQFQSEIFSFFHSSELPVVNLGVQFIEKIFRSSKFNIEEFLTWVEPMTIQKEFKTSIFKLIKIFENISKIDSKFNPTISSLLANFFVIPDLKLQEKALKFFQEIANLEDNTLLEKIHGYIPQIHSKIKQQIDLIISKKKTNTNSEEKISRAKKVKYTFIKKERVNILKTKVAIPNNWNEILFQFGNFIQSKSIIDCEIIFNSFCTQRELFPDDYPLQLKTYEKQFEKSFADHNYHHVKIYFKHKILDLKKEFNLKDSLDCNSNLNNIYLSLILKIENKIKQDSNLPLLCFPTHLSFWIEPKVLLERIISYQASGEEIEITDLAIAISRMPRENIKEALPLLKKIDSGLHPLFNYCFGMSDEINLSPMKKDCKIKLIDLFSDQEPSLDVLWAVATRTFHPNRTFEVFQSTNVKNYVQVISPYKVAIRFVEKKDFVNTYNASLNKYEQSTQILRNNLDLQLPEFDEISNGLLYSLCTINKKEYDKYHRYSDDLQFRSVLFLQSLIPQNLEPLFMDLIVTSSKDTEEGSREGLIAFLNIIQEPNFEFTYYSTYVFASCFLQKRKEIRFTASEILYQLIEKHSILLDDFMKTIIELVKNKYGILSRFTDELFKIKDSSDLVNSALFQIYEKLFLGLNKDKSLQTNFSKLIEPFIDLKIKTGLELSEELKKIFKNSADSSTIKKRIHQLLE